VRVIHINDLSTYTDLLGGAVNACLLPIPEEYNNSNTNIRKYYHEQVYKSSDIDLFIYGLDEEQAKAKMEEIYQTVCDR
jgi:hypothetical protein